MKSAERGGRRLVAIVVSISFLLGLGGLLMPSRVLAEGGVLEEHQLQRRVWWPYAKGPHYGSLPQAKRLQLSVIRLRVGDLDTRGSGFEVPKALRLTQASARVSMTPWLIQLDGPVTRAKKEALRARGVRLYTYYPSNAFVVRAESPADLTSMPGVVWAAPYHPAYRIEPQLGHAPTANAMTALNETIYVRAVLFEAAERHAFVQAVEAKGALVDRSMNVESGARAEHVYLSAAPEVLLDIATRNDLLWIEEVSRSGFVLNAESKVVVQSGSVDLGTPYWDAGVNGSTQVVGVMDSGMDVDTILLSHSDSDAGTPGAGHRKVLAYTAYGGGDLATCGNYSHGTNTSQCAVGNRVDFGQNDEMEGVAHMSKIVFQDIGPSSFISCILGSLSPPASLVASWDEIRSQGGHLMNGSYSICSGYGSHAVDADQYLWDNKDFMMFFSAGNGGNGLVCPGTGKNVVAAGGHYQDPFYNDFYGATGPGPDGRMGPTITAPACDRANGNPAPFDYDTSASFQSSDGDLTGTPEAILNEGSCGTSFSSPYAMGAAALIRDYFEKGYYPSGAANAADGFASSGALVKAVLLNSGEYMTCCGDFMESTSNYGQGMGRLNLSKTLVIDGDTRTPPGMRVVDRGMEAGLATGETHEEIVEITDTTWPLRVTVNWIDYPGSALVNDFRLTVVGPDGGAGQTYRGGNFSGEFTLSEAAGGTADDTVNPFEAVFISPADLASGNWTVRVEAVNVPQGDPAFGDTQPFALVISGGFSSVAVREVSGADSGAPLLATDSSGTDITWIWEDVGDPAATYSFYRGDLPVSAASWAYSHGMIDAGHCGLVSNTTTVSDRQDGISRYYLVAMKKNGAEGTLGSDSAGSARPPADPSCP